MSSTVEKTRFRIAFDNVYGRKPQPGRAGGGIKMDVGAQAPQRRAVRPAVIVPSSQQQVVPTVSPPISVPAHVAAPAPAKSLNGSMIDRVHRAKPGCSACGKKVV